MEQILLVAREGLVFGITGFQVGTYANYAHTVKLLRLIAKELDMEFPEQRAGLAHNHSEETQ